MPAVLPGYGGEVDGVVRRFHSPRDELDAARDETATPELLARLAGSPFEFVREAVADNPQTAPSTLLALVPDQLLSWNDQRLLETIVRNPHSDPAVLERALDRVRTALAAGRRPYFVAQVLAARGVLSPDDVAGLCELPGASARFRGYLRRAAAASAAGEDWTACAVRKYR